MTVQKYQWQSIAETFEHICAGQDPWVAIGNFLNDWWYYAVGCRQELIATPLPPAQTLDTVRWAAFCAAMVEWLCHHDGVPIPEWTRQECYTLQEPWFYYEDWGSRSWLLATTPAPFKVRNIFIGDRMFLRKDTLATPPQSARPAS